MIHTGNRQGFQLLKQVYVAGRFHKGCENKRGETLMLSSLGVPARWRSRINKDSMLNVVTKFLPPIEYTYFKDNLKLAKFRKDF